MNPANPLRLFADSHDVFRLIAQMPDDEAFSVLVRLMQSYDLRSHYTPNMPGLQLRLFQFDRLLEELVPAVFLHLLRQGIKSSMYASQWFLTLFGYRFPLELVAAVFDLVFAEGVEAVFRFGVALLKRNEERVCGMEFEELAEFLKNGLYEVYAVSSVVLRLGWLSLERELMDLLVVGHCSRRRTTTRPTRSTTRPGSCTTPSRSR